MVGKRGHALEIAVEALFGYNGFVTETNKRTPVGEVDVVASHGNYNVCIECKEYSASRSSTITRDIISNVATKGDLLGTKNTVLVTTKPPTDGLLEYAQKAGVVVRSSSDLGRMREDLQKIHDAAKRTQYLIEAFALVDGVSGQVQRRGWLESLFSSEPTFKAEPRASKPAKPAKKAPSKRKASSGGLESWDLLGIGSMFEPEKPARKGKKGKKKRGDSDPFTIDLGW